MTKFWLMGCILLLACSRAAEGTAPPSGPSAPPGMNAMPATVSSAPAESAPAQPMTSRPVQAGAAAADMSFGGASAPVTPAAGAATAGTPSAPSAGSGGDVASTQPGTSSDAHPSDKPSGPINGDPNAPVVELVDVPCRSASELSGGMLGGSSINAQIDGRDLAIDYPCGKHEGAQMTVILNLHGTLVGGASFLYQRGYFSAYRYVDSHNLIVVHPESASQTGFGAQWGNDDGGTDLPHLIAVMTWVYEKFAKFDIRSTWIAGHSWGAVYAEGAYGRPGFVCNEMFSDRFKGVIGLSYIAPPPCADRVSMIGTQGENEDFEQLDQGPVAQMHGCDPTMKGPERVGNNERFTWDGCKPGWVHEDWLMLGKGHIDAMDAEVVVKIIEQIKTTEL